METAEKTQQKIDDSKDLMKQLTDYRRRIDQWVFAVFANQIMMITAREEKNDDMMERACIAYDVIKEAAKGLPEISNEVLQLVVVSDMPEMKTSMN